MKTHLGTTVPVNVVYAAEMKRLAERCAAAGIRLVALRGGALLADDFASAADRHMLDLDLLVAPGHEAEAARMLVEEKWVPIPGGEYCFRKTGPPRYVDLHGELRGVPRRHLESFFTRTRPAGGIPGIYVLADEDDVLVNAYHSVVDHGYLDGKWVRDAADTIRRAGDAFDWKVLAARGRKIGWTAALSLFLETVAEKEKIEIPLNLFRVSGLERFRYGIARRLVENAGPSVARGHVMRLVFMRGPVEIIIALGRTLFPGRSFIRRRYGLSTRGGVLKHVLLRPALVLYKSARLTLHARR